MNNIPSECPCIEVIALVEGQTEKIFIEKIIDPHLAEKGVYITPILLSKPGQKGGDVKFSRAQNDIEKFLKQREDTYVTVLIDFYGTKEWPGLEEAKKHVTPNNKASTINTATLDKVSGLFKDINVTKRFIPYISMHEFEALLFSDAAILAETLQIKQEVIDSILGKFELGPEAINNSPATAPSKRLEKLADNYTKTGTGIRIAETIGLTKMRSACPLFGSWLKRLEELAETSY